MRRVVPLPKDQGRTMRRVVLSLRTQGGIYHCYTHREAYTTVTHIGRYIYPRIPSQGGIYTLGYPLREAYTPLFDTLGRHIHHCLTH